jgi:photosystem II stability/assembly factor-like uncharacterized protein
MEKLGRFVFAGVANGGGYARLYRTSNDGVLWTLSNTGLPDGADPVDFTVNGSSIFVSTHGVGISGDHEYGIYRSTDSGATWTAVNNGLPNNVVGGNSAELFAAYGDLYVSTTYPFNEPMVYKSSDNGNRWSVVGSTCFKNNQPALAFAAAGGYVFAGLGSYSSVFRTANGGTSWEPAKNGLANSAVLSLMKQNERLYAGSQEGLYYSTDKGAHWTEMANGLRAGLPITTMEQNGSNIFLGTDGWGVYRSTDNGANWFPINNGLNGLYSENINELFFANNTLFAATWEGVYKSTDNGSSWIHSSKGLPKQFDGFVETKALASIGGILYVGTSLNKIYKSTDNGAIWTFSGNGISTYASTIYDILSTGNDLYAATEDGVYKSTNQGVSWNFIGLGGPVKRLETYGNGKAIFASKYGATILTGLGIFASTDSGSTWQRYDQGLFSSSSVRALLVDKNLIYGGTDTRSVWVRNLKDGVSQNRNVVSENKNEKGFSITAENPFKNSIRIQLNTNAAGSASIYLNDVTGQLVIRKEMPLFVGNNSFTLSPGKNLAPGIYVLKIVKGNEVRIIRLIKE